ncbi:MAG: RNA helicase [Deltaproteobacteria bacterium CG_4_9_14_3_um_filter_63_12]|nr:MAG: RNA helicase [Deltaproteobacteria bacterium CG_4_9_14_3_um_filter_63_12]
MPFAALGLPDYLLRAVAALTYQEPTAIQAQAIPHVLAGRDVVGVAQTGTGKTAAYALPILLQLNAAARPASPQPLQVLTVAPTRELALQVAAAFRAYAQFSPRKVNTLAVIGGEDLEGQIRALRRGAQVIVGTPGRLLDLIERGELHLAQVQTLVLDEADKLLDLGFADELDKLLALLPPKRQNLLFSATFSPKVAALSERFLSDPVRASVEGELPVVEKIVQRVLQVDRDRRRMLLQHLLEEEGWKQVLVFVASKVAARNLAAKLDREGISAVGFHGDLEQEQRLEALRRFKNQQTRVLVATDVAARGIDIEQLSCVVNYDLPRSPREYIHRIGRTGRAGHKGLAVSFVDPDSEAHFALIEKRAAVSLAREQIPGFEPIVLPAAKTKGAPAVKGRRKSKKDKLRAAAAKALAQD